MCGGVCGTLLPVVGGLLRLGMRVWGKSGGTKGGMQLVFGVCWWLGELFSKWPGAAETGFYRACSPG